MTVITQTAENLDTPRTPAAPVGRHPNALVHAGAGLAADMLSSLLFAVLFSFTHDAALSIGIAIGAGLAQIGFLKVRGKSVDVMQWASLGLVIVFGGASLMTHDPRFMMVKPSLIYCAVGTVMLKRGWMNRYMLPEALAWSNDVVTVFGYLWAAMMFATAGLNLVLALNSDTKMWALFVGVFPIASKGGLFAVQYITTRAIVIHRMKAAGALA